MEFFEDSIEDSIEYELPEDELEKKHWHTDEEEINEIIADFYKKHKIANINISENVIINVTFNNEGQTVYYSMNDNNILFLLEIKKRDICCKFVIDNNTYKLNEHITHELISIKSSDFLCQSNELVESNLFNLSMEENILNQIANLIIGKQIVSNQIKILLMQFLFVSSYIINKHLISYFG